MNFEELYEKYQNKTATPEEAAFVEAEIAKAKQLVELIDEQDAKHAIAPAENATVKRSVARFLKRTKLRVAILAFSICLALALLGTGGFFAAASLKAASNSSIDRTQSIELCKKWMTDTFDSFQPSDFTVVECERELVLHHGFSRAYYEYEIEIVYGGAEYEFWVNSTTGITRVDKD